MKPPLPPYLESEEKSLWSGWNSIGDREVVREAAVKGNVSLALKFLAKRKDLDHADVERWLKAEILSWVYQLLLRKQVFKASHILNNVGYDPVEQLSVTLCETTDKEMRDYIAEHLIKINKLDDAILKSWKFIKLIEDSNSSLKSFFGDVSKLSIVQFDQMCGEFKAEIATEIFFQSYDFCLESFVTAEYSWRYLLKNEEFEILKLWIKIYFTQDLNSECNITSKPEVLNQLKNLFLLWPITHLMINEIDTLECSELFKNFILNELSLYGIFTNSEKNNIKSIISRFVQTGNVQNIYKILEEPTSNILLSDYFEKLAYFCIENNLFEVLSICTKGYHYPDTTIQKIDSKEFKLFISINNTLGNLNNEKILRKNIYQVSNFFAESNIHEYLKNNPLILLALIFYDRDTNMSDILLNKSSVIIGDITFDINMLFDYLKDLPILRNVMINFSSSEAFSNISLEELINKNENLLCILEYNNKNKNAELPYYLSYTSNDYTNEINYIYYIKRSRPSKAVKLFLIDQFQRHGKICDDDKYEKTKIVEKIAFNNWTNPNITSSCVMFLELIGSSSNKIRVLIDVFNLLKQIYKNPNDITNLFNDDPKKILEAIENILIDKCDILTNNDNLVEVLYQQSIPVKFARVNNLELPEKFLKYCASHNLWLLFLIFSQINDYSLDEIIKLVQYFENENITEHLHHALSKDIQKYEEVGQSDDLVTSMTSQYSINSTVSDLNFDMPKVNLLTILIKCHKSEDPPTSLLIACQHYKYPLLAVLATCYEPDSVVTNWLTWLSISCNIDIETVDNYAISAQTVTNLLKEVISKKFIRTALESFEIFMSNHPLCLLLQFLELSVNFDFKSSIKYLESFENVVQQLKYNPIIEENDFEYMFLNNGYWIVETALKLIFATLGNCFESRNHQITFLDNLCSSNLSKSIPTECPNFCKISNLLKSLSYSDISIDLSAFWNPSDRKSEIVRCIEILIQSKNFKYALELAKFEKIFKEYVLNAEWSHNFQNRSDNFWIECNSAFRSSNILPSSAAEFFVNCCKELEECSDKYRALKLAYTWLKESDYTDPYVENIEQEIWAIYFGLDDETLKGSHYDKHETNYLLSEIQENSVVKTQSSHSLNNEQLRHFDETIGKILASGDIIEALRLEKMFDYKNIETSILMTCYELAEKKISPYQLTTEQRLLYMNRDMNLKSLTNRRRTHKSTRMSSRSTGSLSSISTDVETCEHSNEDTLVLLENLTDRLVHGSNIANRILMCYRISLNIGKPYKLIVKCLDSQNLLRQALDSDCKNKLEVVSDIFTIFKWSKKEISRFISEEIMNAIYKSVRQNLDAVVMWDLILDKFFHLILQLCTEFTSKLGERLLKCANTIHLTHSQALSDKNDKDVEVIIELLIRSHECFTAECNMEGISAILRKAQTLTATLLALKSWNLMVRLLTGIGRYTEMNYIFQILKENDQFEYLLKKGYRNDNSLKTALLKFLKIHCPKNQKLFQMVALCFTLFSEVAELFENEAMEIIENLIEISRLEMQNQGLSRTEKFVLLTKNDSTEVCLKKSMESYTHAAEYHLHGEKLTKAMIVASQAELVALQMALLKKAANNQTVKCILNIEKSEIQYLILNDLSFPQAKILIDSYNYQPDWGAVLFQHCILNSDISYLKEFLKAYPLTNTLAQEVTGRFVPKKITSVSSIRAMKEFITHINNVQVKYRIASELGFTDVIESLLNDQATLAFLKDTVWKKGFKQT